MRKFSIISIVFCSVFLSSIKTLAQTDDSNLPKEIYIGSGFSEEVDNYAKSLYNQLQNNFDAKGLDYELVSPTNPGDNYLPNLRFGVRHMNDEQILIWIIPLTPKKFTHTSLLETQYDYQYDSPGIFVYWYASDDLVAKKLTIELLSALSLYSIGDCPNAEIIFDEIDELAKEVEIGYLKSFEQDDILAAQIAFYRANCAVLRGDYVSAIEFYEASLLYYGPQAGLAEGYLIYFAPAGNLAWSYLQVGEQDKAFELMNFLVKSAPSSNYSGRVFESMIKRSQIYALAFRYDEALMAINEAIDFHPLYSVSYVQRGQIYMLLYEWDEAMADYNTAIELDPNYADAYFYRGVLYYTQAVKESAKEDFERYLELAPAGDHAEEASKYIESIVIELDALNG